MACCPQAYLGGVLSVFQVAQEVDQQQPALLPALFLEASRCAL